MDIMALFLAIPIVAIILNSPPARAIAKAITLRAERGEMDVARVAQLEAHVSELSQRVLELETENQRLLSKYDFLERLLEAPDGTQPSE
ncbi:MAG: hypothetical protein D6675_12035 [Gemmatimonadetes bacterium]|nr:MAG: hypothetical protein D6675_12035 [Gemmatimonadota bacterium]